VTENVWLLAIGFDTLGVTFTVAAKPMGEKTVPAKRAASAIARSRTMVTFIPPTKHSYRWDQYRFASLASAVRQSPLSATLFLQV
jgi:hypothetical protein